MTARAADSAWPRVTRRPVQVALGLLWILDGLLQFQPAMLTRRFATRVIAAGGAGQPAFVSGPISEVVRIILHQPAIADLSFGLIQLAIGLGMLCRRTVRWALAASVAWALSVWYLGEGLGGLLGGGASLLTGAPGAALLYAVLALIVFPRHDQDGGPPAQQPARWAALAWAVLWLGGAVLQLLPGSDTNASIGMSLAMNASGAPGWFAPIGNHLAALVPEYGVSLVIDLVVLQAFAGLGVLMARRMRLAAVILGIGLAVLYWLAGQDMGQFWSGMATDPNTAPLIVLLAVTVLGAPPWSRRTIRAAAGDAAAESAGQLGRPAAVPACRAGPAGPVRQLSPVQDGGSPPVDLQRQDAPGDRGTGGDAGDGGGLRAHPAHGERQHGRPGAGHDGRHAGCPQPADQAGRLGDGTAAVTLVQEILGRVHQQLRLAGQRGDEQR
jgi:hypothetical protein